MKTRLIIALMTLIVAWSSPDAPIYAATPSQIKIGAWNIEWLGKPGNRSGLGKDVAQKPKDIANYIKASGVSILSLEEIGLDSAASSTNKTLDDAFAAINASGTTDWKYELFPKKSNSVDQHVGVAWNEKVVQKVGAVYQVPVDDSHFDFNLLERGVHAAQFTLGGGQNDFVLVPLHMKSNRGGATRTSQQRAVEAQRIADALDELEDHFDDLDIVLLGDTNVLSATEGAIASLLGGGEYRDLNASDLPTTFSGPAPFDRIFFKASQPEFITSTFEVFRPSDRTNAEHKRDLSDHFMVVGHCLVQADDDLMPITRPRPTLSLAAARGLAAADDEPLSTVPFGAFESIDKNYRGPNSDEDFELSQDYPRSYLIDERFPWEEIDFRTHPKAYMNAALKYCFEGNESIGFVVQDNKTRKWYHAPWLHDDGEDNGAGREYVHGLTRERRSRPLELHPLQKDNAQNWAIGFYNDRGGYTLGNVWRTPDGKPNPTASTFPDNTITFKLLFTDAPVEQVPYLKIDDAAKSGALTWKAHIYKDTSYKLPRELRDVRLMQVDIAIKDPRAADSTGWVFGTYIFDGSRNRKSLIDNLVLVGLSWHDDEGNFTRDSAGAVENPRLRGSIINTELLEPQAKDGTAARMHHLGYGGRMNGPVDNRISSCISCHARAAVGVPTSTLSPKDDASVRARLMPFFNSFAAEPTDFSEADKNRFFRSIRGGSHLESDQGIVYVTTDYSQQIAVGIRNFYTRQVKCLAARAKSRGVAPSSPEITPPLGSRGN